jgi:bifunctional non-homologous end joining protein LigD
VAGSLDAYQKKRNFDLTSEPRGKASNAKATRAAKKTALTFVIQKHAATRLHYDFRLELDGVLKSWAVTRGPSLVPGEKRLAVHVEDHPLEYGTFEGTIPAGEYGAGSVMLWDQGTWIPDGDPHKGYAKGRLDFTLEGEKLHGRWHLVRMRGKPGEKADNWLLIKSDDEAARTEDEGDILEDLPRSVSTGRTIEEIGGDRKSRTWNSNNLASVPAPAKDSSPRKRAAAPLDAPATKAAPKRKIAKTAKPVTFTMPKGTKRAALPSFVEPELATLSAKPPVGAPWLHEVKFDGYRMQASIKNGKVMLRTRKGIDWTERFAPIASALATLPIEDALLDGEIVVEDASGIADFAGLQKALKDGDVDDLVYYAFDLLHLNGHDLTKVPLDQRKALLEQLIGSVSGDTHLRYSAHFDENGELMLKHICQLSAEGIVSKRRDTPYRSGRGTDWLKSKCANRQEFVIIGFVPSTAANKAIGSLVVGYYNDTALVHAGRVGTGFSGELAKQLYRDLAADTIPKSVIAKDVPAEARKNVVWVAPTRVAEVEFRGWTGGGLLRQASFKGLREDKDPREITREEPSVSPQGQKAETRALRNRPSDVRLTHPDRVLWPEAGITKEALADYYTMVWPRIEKHVTGRPLALVRCPTGIGHCFFQKHVWDGMSGGIVEVSDPGDKEKLVAISSLSGLLGLVQASVLEIHPWGAKADDLERPDRLTIDLDPGDNVPWTSLVAGAREVRQRLEDLGLKSFTKTTGGKGLHVVVPLVPSADWDSAKAFCRTLAESMAADAPDLYVSTMTKRVRTGRIYVDYLRNGRGATAVSAFSTRARASCGVSTPVSFDELDMLRSGDHFTLNNLARRLEFLSADPWADFFKVKQKLPTSAVGGKRAKVTRARR